MQRLLYSILYSLLLPIVLLRLWWRGRQNPAYRQRWAERFGRYHSPVPVQPPIVFHAVSVGEVHAALPLIEQFLREQPTTPVVVTTTTPTGSARVAALLNPRVQHVYLPYDVPWAVERFFRHFHPQALVLLETELWPNLLYYAAEQGCPVLLVNARLSQKSLTAYQRIGLLARHMLAQLTAVAAQSEADGERFVALGLPAHKLHVTGSLKYDMAIQADKVAAAQALKSRWHSRPVWIAASTREGEDTLVLQAFAQVLQKVPTALLVLVPRHPERFASAAAEVTAKGLRLVSRSSGSEVDSTTQVLLGDSLGEMHFYYSLADVAFVGGSLVDTGCQNIIEPAALGLPVITGPSLYNFQAASEALRQGGGMLVVEDAQGLGIAVASVLANLQLRQSMARKAKSVVAANLGSTARLLEIVHRYSRSH